TNRAATDFEVAQSRSIINSAEKRVSVLQTAMADLAERIANIHRVIEIHRAAISPLKAFPPELLVAIFVECIGMMKNPRLALPKPPLMFMKICSRWRAIVLDTPQFW
ncbi:hypothetical protein BD779DRAFT_1412160, partial [Infundibulicybe gibba]